MVQVKSGGLEDHLARALGFMVPERKDEVLAKASINPLRAARNAAASHLFRFASVSALCFGVVVGIHHLEPLRGIESHSQQVCLLR